MVLETARRTVLAETVPCVEDGPLGVTGDGMLTEGRRGNEGQHSETRDWWAAASVGSALSEASTVSGRERWERSQRCVNVPSTSIPWRPQGTTSETPGSVARTSAERRPRGVVYNHWP